MDVFRLFAANDYERRGGKSKINHESLFSAPDPPDFRHAFRSGRFRDRIHRALDSHLGVRYPSNAGGAVASAALVACGADCPRRGAVDVCAQRLYRDVRYVIPFVVQFWMFASPVGVSEFPGARAVALGFTD